MTAESLINEFETLPSVEQKKFFVYLAKRESQFDPASVDEEGVSDAEFDEALQKVMVDHRGLLHRLAQ
ncbi:MAG: hypothetical protein ACR2H1_09815 [Limisphaerales bacterium]